jgi:hypothetical protein
LYVVARSRFARLIIETPLPMHENAGINIQNHHPCPIPERDNAIETKMNPRPTNNCLIPSSAVTRLFLRPFFVNPQSSRMSGSCGSADVN